MKIVAVLALLPSLSLAFTTTHKASVFVPPTMPRRATTLRQNELEDACDTVVSTTENVLQKADSLVVSRVVRLVDHAPVLLTLKHLADTAGLSLTGSGLAAAPSAFAGLSTALAVPTWCYHLWAVVAIGQVASVAKSALAEGSNDLSQRDISTVALANVLAARTIGSANPLLDTALVAVASGYALRQGGRGGDPTVHSLAVQLMAAFTGTLTVLGAVSAVTDRLSFVGASATTLLGVAAAYVLSRRADNGTVVQAVHGGVLGGALYARLAAGLSWAWTVESLVGHATTVGLAYVAYQAVNRVRQAVFA